MAQKIDKRDWSKPWKNPIVLMWFGVLMAVLMTNFFMVGMAISTNPGLVIDNAYERGKNHAAIIARRQEMEQMGWQLRVDMPILTEGRAERVTLNILDRDNVPFDVDSATLYFYRPSDKNLDGELVLQSAGSSGQYMADFELPVKGKWDLIVEVVKGDKHFSIGRSIMVQADS
ncbi:FixH family protein [Thiomicrospira aerophila AL3]|uniref:FixH family protein n=1 Tax=Thiomicrospira aerophila AL3 TaxID=717772 RepID=W0DU82_9GAMM|nr:FixH family protein [Thiomicrospira aerophila]AHF02002.1 FixH family protein [Thiomicrospira aerophila AL3]